MKTDVEILEEQYEKYKDKNGRKAVSLWVRLQSCKAFEKLVKELNNK